MKTVEDVFAAIGGPKKMAEVIGVKVSAAGNMKNRGNIPVEHWFKVIEAIPSKQRMSIGQFATLMVNCEIARKSNDT